MGPNVCLLVIHIVIGTITAPLLFAGSVYLLAVHHTIGASVFILVSAILMAVGLFLNILLFRQKLDEWYDPRALDHMKFMSVITGAASFVSFGFHLTKAIRVHSDLTLSSYYVSTFACVLAMLTSIWFYSLVRWNKRFVELCNPLLSRPPPEPWRPPGMG